MAGEFRILIVEDEPDFADSLIKLIKSVDDSINITLVSSRDEAKAVLLDKEDFFDFISLDLKIPAVQGGFDKTPDHGLAVLGNCSEFSPGTPILILTGSNDIGMVSKFLAHSSNIDVWAEGSKRPTVDHLPKVKMDEFIEKFTSVYNAVISLADVELTLSRGLVLPIQHDRLLRIFIKSLNGVRANIKVNESGLSDAKIYFVNIYENGNLTYRSVAKCGSLLDIHQDNDNYERMISRLQPEVTPRKLKVLEFGAKELSGVFYGFAHEYGLSFFEAAFEKKLNANVLKYIQAMTSPWLNTSVERRRTVADLRRRVVSDVKAEELIAEYKLTWAKDFEDNEFQTKEACIHGDLHGENILVDVDSGRATLIDYGDVSTGACAFDPLTLECSFLFHPDGLDDEKKPSLKQIESWADLDVYLDGSPVEQEIRFCREWADSVKVGNRELAACLYSYSLKQLKYPDTNKDIALALLGVAKQLYENS